MEVFNILYNFFGFDLLAESATLLDFLNCGFKVGLAIFITCYFLKAFGSIFTVLSSGSFARW